MKKVLITLLVIIVIVIVGGLSYIKFALPNVGAPEQITIKATPENIQRGAYLANHVTVCMDCHSTRDWNKFSAPPVPGTTGMGGEYFGPELSFPGKFYARNITPAHLKDWTDGEILRAVSTGVNKKGEALFPVMPYLYYGKMDQQDLYDIIAYIRTLAPIENKVPERSIDFPMNFIVNTIPKKATYTKRPPVSDTVQYGAYMTSAAGCVECHTPVDKGQIKKELSFGGGRDFKLPNGTLISANITPDENAGIGKWTVDDFISRFKAYANSENIETMGPKDLNTIMPWTMYAGMDTTDLRAIYFYLRTIKPISNKYVHFNPGK